MAEGGGDGSNPWNNKAAFDCDDDTDSSRERIGNQARVLMAQFISERVESEGLGDSLTEDDLYVPGTPRDPQVIGPTEEVRQIGTSLRAIGDQLDGDDRLQALLGSISPESTKDTFLDVAREIFSDGNFNWGRVVMLFYFAYKMAVKAIKKAPLIRTIIEWVVKFIKDYVATWIISRGGWSAIQEYFGSTTTQTAAVFFIGILTAILSVKWRGG